MGNILSLGSSVTSTGSTNNMNTNSNNANNLRNSNLNINQNNFNTNFTNQSNGSSNNNYSIRISGGRGGNYNKFITTYLVFNQNVFDLISNITGNLNMNLNIGSSNFNGSNIRISNQANDFDDISMDEYMDSFNAMDSISGVSSDDNLNEDHYNDDEEDENNYDEEVYQEYLLQKRKDFINNQLNQFHFKDVEKFVTRKDE